MTINPIMLRQFAEQARSKGYDDKTINSFINDRMQEQAYGQMVGSGAMEITSVPQQYQVGAYQGASGSGWNPKTKEAEPKTAADAKLIGEIKSALSSYRGAQKKLGEDFEKGNLALIGAQTPYTPWGRGVEADLFNLADVILRIRTGAQAPEKEIKRYMRQKAPGVLDPDDVKKDKMDNMLLELTSVAEAMGLDVDQLLKEAGIGSEQELKKKITEPSLDLSQDNIETNRLVDQGVLPEEQREIYPQAPAALSLDQTTDPFRRPPNLQAESEGVDLWNTLEQKQQRKIDVEKVLNDFYFSISRPAKDKQIENLQMKLIEEYQKPDTDPYRITSLKRQLEYFETADDRGAFAGTVADTSAVVQRMISAPGTFGLITIKQIVDANRSIATIYKNYPSLSYFTGPAGQFYGAIASPKVYKFMDQASDELEEATKKVSVYNPDAIDKLQNSVTSLSAFVMGGSLLSGALTTYTSLTPQAIKSITALILADVEGKMEMGSTFDRRLEENQVKVESGEMTQEEAEIDAATRAGADYVGSLVLNYFTNKWGDLWSTEQTDLFTVIAKRPSIESLQEVGQKLVQDLLVDGTIEGGLGGVWEEFIYTYLATILMAGGGFGLETDTVIRKDGGDDGGGWFSNIKGKPPNIGAIRYIAEKTNTPPENLIDEPVDNRTDVQKSEQATQYGLELDTREQRRYNALKYAYDNNIPLPLSATTDSAFLHYVEANALKGITGESVRKDIRAAYNGLIDKNNEIAAEFTKDKPNISEINTMADKALIEFKDVFDAKKTELYGSISKEVWSAPSAPDKTIAALEEIVYIKSQSKFQKGGTDIKTYKNMLKEFKAGVTLGELKATRTDIMNKSGMNEFEHKLMRKLTAALTTDIDTNMEAISPADAERLRQANNFYATHIEIYESSIGKSLFDQNTDKITSLIKKGELRKAETLKAILSPNEEAWELVQTQFVAELIEKSTKTIRTKEGTENYVDPVKLETNMKSYGDEILVTILGENKVNALYGLLAELKNIDNLKTYMSTAAKVSEGSQTAFLLKSGITGGLTALAFNPTAAVFLVAGPVAAQKLLSSQNVRDKFLSVFDKKSLRMLQDIRGETQTNQGISLDDIGGEEGFASVRSEQDLIDMVKSGQAIYDQPSGMVKELKRDVRGERVPLNLGRLSIKAARDAGIVKKKTASSPPSLTTSPQKKGIALTDLDKVDPNLVTKESIKITDIHGDKKVIPEGEPLTPYVMKKNKVLLQDDDQYVVSKNQYENIKGHSIKMEGTEFAPELEQTTDVIKGDYDYAEKERARMGLPSGAEVEGVFLPKYDEYQLPGGKNYREILIQVPHTQSKLEDMGYKFIVDDYGSATVVINPDGVNMGKWPTLESAVSAHSKTAGDFMSSHWKEPNVLAWIRLNERTFKNKYDTTFMEEIQSDWASELRKKGSSDIDIKPEDIVVRESKYSQSQRGAVVTYKGENVYGGSNRPDSDIWWTGDKSEMDIKMDAINYIKSKGVAGHPLLKNWQELAVKRALVEAVDNNSDYFSWISGEQTSNRYNLAIYLDSVSWLTDEDIGGGNKEILLHPKQPATPGTGAGVIKVDINESGRIVDASRTGQSRDWIGKDLDEVVGKGLADKIMESEEGDLSGEGLKFGGEWAENLYDKQIKNIVKDLTGADAKKTKLLLEEMYPDERILADTGQDPNDNLIDWVYDGARSIRDQVVFKIDLNEHPVYYNQFVAAREINDKYEGEYGVPIGKHQADKLIMRQN